MNLQLSTATNSWPENFDAPDPEPAILEAGHRMQQLDLLLIKPRQSQSPLNDREMRIVLLISQGYNSIEISKVLKLAPDTIDASRKLILRKTKCRNTAQVVATAIRKGWMI